MRMIYEDELRRFFKNNICGFDDDNKQLLTVCEDNKWHDLIELIPTAYDIDRVVEELEERTDFLSDCTKYGNKTEKQGKMSYSTMMMYEVADLVDDLIEIVKQGGVNNRKDCEYRHENGNCLKVGGFCTSVDDKHCEKMKQDSTSDDVCEWESKSGGEFIQNPHTKRLYSNEPSMKNIYCNTCGKKIKEMEGNI